MIVEDATSQNPFVYRPLHPSASRPFCILARRLLTRESSRGFFTLRAILSPVTFSLLIEFSVLEMLASQAAISLENTWLYRDLEDRERKIRRLIDSNIIGIVIWNLEGAIVAANEAFLQLTQYDREDVNFGRLRWTNLTPADGQSRDERALEELKGTGTVQPYEKEFLRKDGSRVPVLAGAARFEGSQNEGVAFVLDLSEQKRAEHEIRTLKDELHRENLALRGAYSEISELKEKLAQEKLSLEQEIRGEMDLVKELSARVRRSGAMF